MSLGKVNHFTGKDEGSLGNHLRDGGGEEEDPYVLKRNFPLGTIKWTKQTNTIHLS